MKKDNQITRGFIATDSKNNSAKATITIHEVGFFVIIEEPGQSPKQFQRKFPGTAIALLNGHKDDLKKKGYTKIKDLGYQTIKIDKDTGMYKESV